MSRRKKNRARAASIASEAARKALRPRVPAEPTAWPTWPRPDRLAVVCVSLLVLTEGLLRLASLSRPAVTFDVGPNTESYLTGFTESWEYRPVTARWVGRQGSIALPLVGGGDECLLRVRYARLRPTPADVRVLVNGQLAASWTAQPVRTSLEDWLRGGRRGSPFQEFHVQAAPVRLSPGPLQIEFAVDGDGPDALAIDWVRLEAGRWRLGWPALGTRAIVVGAFVVAILCGISLAAAAAIGVGVAFAQAAWAALDPFAVAHAANHVALPAISAAVLTALLLRRWPAARAMALVLLAAYLLKGAGVFHPSFYYPDVLTHARYAAALTRVRGSLAERGERAQLAANVAYPRYVAGKAYALAYSPVFYVPFTWFAMDRAALEEAMKQVALAAAALEVLAVFLLAAILGGFRIAAAAAVLSAFLPPLHSRLLLAMWPTLAGHLLDTLAIAAAAWMVVSPGWNRAAACGALTLAASMTYISSLFNLGGFFASLAALDGRSRRWALLIGGGTAALTVGVLYMPFTRTFVTEIAPAWWHQGSEPGAGALASAAAALHRIPLFYGYGYPVLAVAGLVLAYRQYARTAFRVLCAYAIALAVLVGLRAFSGGLFKDLKEVEFAGPLVCVTSAITLAALAQRGRLGRITSVALVCALAAFGLVKYRGYFRAAVFLADLG
jgi:hypothetical protein